MIKNLRMRQIQTVRMSEIAQRLGVAPSTVSRALRADPQISVEVRRQVEETARKMGYRPNPLVSALMASRRRRGGHGEVDVIALVTNYGGREGWRSKDVCRWFFDGIQARAAALGFWIEVISLGACQGNMSRLEKALHARGIHGVLLGFSREEAEEQVPFRTEGFAVAGLSTYFRSTVVDRANFHGFFNVQLALEQIRQRGYRRPALVVPEFNNRISSNSWSGAFLDWQRRLPKGDRCEPFIPTDAENADAFDVWFEANRPDALLVYKVPVRRFLSARRRAIPHDVGLAYLYRTADEMGEAAGIDGNLSVVGGAALDLVVEKLNANLTGASPHPKEVLIKGTWREGATLPARKAPKILPAPNRSRAPRAANA